MTEEIGETQQDQTVAVWLPGRVWNDIAEGDWQNENPRGWLALQTFAHTRKVGTGHQFFCRIRRDDALDLADYLTSVVEAVESMTGEEREGQDVRPMKRAIALLRGDDHD